MSMSKSPLATCSEENRERFAPTFDEHRAWIYAIVASLHIPHGWREDAVQSASLAFIEAIERFDPNRGASLQTYAYHSVKSAALKAAYGQAKRLDSHDDQHAPNVIYLSTFAADLSDLSLAQESTDTTCDTLDVIVASETAAEKARLVGALTDWVASLPPSKRDLLVRIYCHGEQQADVARARGVSKAAINQALNRLFREGRWALKPVLQPLAAV